jgi:hypothetical protein
MSRVKALVVERLRVPWRTLALYLAVYLPWGFAMNALGKAIELAEFTFLFQVLTCYGGWLVPWSLWVRGKSIFQQYLFGLLSLGILEFLGYWFQTSIAHPGNLVNQVFNVENFSLAMVLFFATYLPLGNVVVGWIHRKVFKQPVPGAVAPHWGVL